MNDGASMFFPRSWTLGRGISGAVRREVVAGRCGRQRERLVRSGDAEHRKTAYLILGFFISNGLNHMALMFIFFEASIDANLSTSFHSIKVISFSISP